MRGDATNDGTGTRDKAADGAEDTAEKVGNLSSGAAPKGTAAEDATDSAADAAKDAAEQAVEQLTDGATGEQVLNEVGDGAEQVSQQAESCGLLAGSDTTAKNAGNGAETAGGEGETADAHGHGLIEAGHGVDEGLHHVVGVGGMLLHKLICLGVRPRSDKGGRRMLTDLVDLLLHLIDHLPEGVHVEVHLALAHHHHHHRVGAVVLALAGLITTLITAIITALLGAISNRRGQNDNGVGSRGVLLGLDLLRVLSLILHRGSENPGKKADKTESLELHDDERVVCFGTK